MRRKLLVTTICSRFVLPPLRDGPQLLLSPLIGTQGYTSVTDCTESESSFRRTEVNQPIEDDSDVAIRVTDLCWPGSGRSSWRRNRAADPAFHPGACPHLHRWGLLRWIRSEIRTWIRILIIQDVWGQLTWVRILKAQAMPTWPIPTTVTLLPDEVIGSAISIISFDLRDILAWFGWNWEPRKLGWSASEVTLREHPWSRANWDTRSRLGKLGTVQVYK